MIRVTEKKEEIMPFSLRKVYSLNSFFSVVLILLSKVGFLVKVLTIICVVLYTFHCKTIT